MAHNRFPKVIEIKSNEVLNLIHIDVCGPVRTITLDNKKYN